MEEEEEIMEEQKWVLVVGGSGYLGMHLLQELSATYRYDHIAFTYNSNVPPSYFLASMPSLKAFKVDLQSGEGFDAISNSLGQPVAVINCAALCVPRACELDPSAAMAINVPKSLISWMSAITSKNAPLLVHMSTDQVYDGSKSFHKEEDKANPVNVYGQSKLMAEEYIQMNYPNFVILRSSIIYGPQPVIPVKKSLPIQWINDVLATGREAKFFDDEFRCPIYVKDVTNVILSLIERWDFDQNSMNLILNLGGPDRVSRVEMAGVVAELKGYDKLTIKAVSATSVDRGVASPADISMDVSNLIQTTGIKLTSFKDGVQLTLDLPAVQTLSKTDYGNRIIQ